MVERLGGLVGVNNINLEFNKGELVGIIRASGSGKSTLVELLPGLRQPDKEKSSNCEPLRVSAQSQYRSKVGLVSQSPAFFEGTITKISANLKGVTEDSLTEAARLARP